MSAGLMVAVWQSELPPVERAVALVLAWHTRPEQGAEAWPSAKTIHEWTGYHEATVSRALMRLEKAGVIVATSARGGGRRSIRWVFDERKLFYYPEQPPTLADVDEAVNTRREQVFSEASGLGAELPAETTTEINTRTVHRNTRRA